MGLIKYPTIPFLKDRGRKHEYLLTSEIKFGAAHRLSDCEGKYSRIHGHTYRVVITVKSFKLNNWGAVMDFDKLKKIFKDHIKKKYDHKLILWVSDNENRILSRAMGKNWVTWMNSNPTAENIARDIWSDLIPAFNMLRNINLIKVTVYETATNAATYQEGK